MINNKPLFASRAFLQNLACNNPVCYITKPTQKVKLMKNTCNRANQKCIKNTETSNYEAKRNKLQKQTKNQ